MIEIKQDVFDIAWRLRQINSDYKLFYNSKSKRFEVHSRFGLEVALPYSTLDARAVHHVQKTQLKNKAKLVAEIERNNERVEKEKRQEIIEKALAAYGEQL